MNYNTFVREIVRKSKYTETHLTIPQTKVCIELMKEVVEELLLNGDSLVLQDFVKFDVKELQSKKIRNVRTGELDLTRDLRVPRVKLSRHLREELKQKMNV